MLFMVYHKNLLPPELPKVSFDKPRWGVVCWLTARQWHWAWSWRQPLPGCFTGEGRGRGWKRRVPGEYLQKWKGVITGDVSPVTISLKWSLFLSLQIIISFSNSEVARLTFVNFSDLRDRKGRWGRKLQLLQPAMKLSSVWWVSTWQGAILLWEWCTIMFNLVLNLITFQHELSTCRAGRRDPAVATPTYRARTGECQQEEREEVDLDQNLSGRKRRRSRNPKHKYLSWHNIWMGLYWRGSPACISTFLIMILWSSMALDKLVASLSCWSVCPRSCDLLWYVNAFQKMASLALRQGLTLTSRSCYTRMAKISQGPSTKVTQPFFLAPLKKFSSSAAMSDRYQDELLQKQMANDNPFDTYVTKPETGKGLFEGSPVLVPSTRYLVYFSEEMT